MREQIERLIAWAKAHPWLAALIVGGVVLLGYIAYKRSGGTGGSRGELFEPAEQSPAGIGIPDAGSAGTGAGFEIPVPSTGGAGTTTPVASVPATVSQTPFQFAAPDFSDAYSGVGITGTGSLAGYAAAAPAQQVTASTKTPTGGQKFSRTPARPVERAVRASTGRSTGVVRTAVTTPGLPLQTGMGKITARAGTSARPLAPIGISGRRPVITPAQRVGKPANYSGWALGIYYVNGYPSSPIPIMSNIRHPGR